MKKKINEEKVIKYVRNLIYRTMTVIVIFLAMAIISKSSQTYKDILVTNVYEKNISFAQIKKLYQKYLGGITPLDKKIDKELTVFSEKESNNSSNSQYNNSSYIIWSIICIL